MFSDTQDQLQGVMKKMLDDASIAECLQIKQALDLYIAERKVAALFQKPKAKEAK